MGTDELAMGWIKDEIGRAVGLPREIGGIPLDEIGATGFGLASAIDVAASASRCHWQVRGWWSRASARSASTQRASREKGAVLVAASDTARSADAGVALAAGEPARLSARSSE